MKRISQLLKKIKIMKKIQKRVSCFLAKYSEIRYQLKCYGMTDKQKRVEHTYDTQT